MKNITSSPLRFTFSKEERLSRKKIIEELFKNGSSFHFPPFKIHALEREFGFSFPAQVLITVSSRNFPGAVERNRVKRLMREAYRVNKHLLYESLKHRKKELALAFIYTGKKIEAFEIIREKMVSVLQRLSEQYGSHEKNSR